MPAEFYFKFLFLAGFIGLLILAVCLVYSLFANRNFTCVCVTNTYFFFKRFFGSDAWADNEKAFEDAEAVAVDFLTVKLNSDDVAVSLCVCVCVCVCVCMCQYLYGGCRLSLTIQMVTDNNVGHDFSFI